MYNEMSISKFGIEETIEQKLAFNILSKYTKSNNSRKINYKFIEKETMKYAKKNKGTEINVFTPFVVAEIIECGSVYSVFD